MVAHEISSITSIALTDAENQLVGEIEAWLEAYHPDESKMVRESFFRLRLLGDAVFSYPSIRDTQFLRGEVFDEGRLVESLLAFSSSSHLLRIPTKIVAMRSFLVAKFHSFSLLSSLTVGKEDYHEEIRKIVFSIISTLIAEAVYFSCMDDPHFSRDTKSSLASDLIGLWDSGVDLRGLRHFSALSSLWLARNSSPPNFGTMDGNTELLRLTIDLDEDWREFLVEESSNDQTRWALEEFLFALSWEEIQEVRKHLALSDENAVGLDGIHGYLDSRPIFSGIDEEDPRTFYDFFIERRDACIFRKKLSAPGPRHTLEEIYLKYRIIMELR
ncbi:MAG: hypothetical protein FWD88_00395 [Treponema sp.]|nr:hypothetical protein [Treponema sp.]